MKKLVYPCLVLLFFISGIKTAHAQAISVGFDSLQNALKLQKTIQGRMRVLQELVDADPTFALHEPKYMVQLLELNKQAKLIDPYPYQLLQQALQYAQAGQTRQALNTTEMAVNEFDKQHKMISPLLFNIRLYFNKLNDQEARLKFYQKQLEYYQVNGPIENTASCYHGIAGYYFYQAEYNQSITYYLKGAEVYRKFNPRLYFNAISVVGANYILWGNNEKALYYMEKVLMPLSKTWGKGDVNNWTCTYYHSLSELSVSKHNYQLAISELNEGLNHYRDQKTNTGINAILLVSKALVYLKLNDTKSALPILLRAKTITDSAAYPILTTQGKLEVDYGFYQYYRQLGNNAEAEKYLNTAYQKAKKENSNELQLRKYLKELSIFYESVKQPLMALQYDHQYFDLLDKVEKEQNKYKVAQYEIDENDKQQRDHINQLKQEKAVQDYQISRRNSLLWGSLVVLLLITALLVFIYRQLQINKKTLISLRKTQRQLIQSEKMASLGELTAGIAHEIQNPLNFVNNFSEVSIELLDELKGEAKAGNNGEVIGIADDLTQNLQKINHHGKRADFIVKGMLQHSRTGTGEKQLTNLNVIADEFLKLSFHGLRAKDKNFNAEIKTHFDNNLPKVNVVQQDMGRVLLNLFNNAFYAVNHKARQADKDYKPEVSVATSTVNGQIIKVKDNGNGIPDAIKDKIMQPFFTTKPTGEGTGLGLSLSYDIVVKGHEGNIEMTTREGEYTEFIIYLPI